MLPKPHMRTGSNRLLRWIYLVKDKLMDLNLRLKLVRIRNYYSMLIYKESIKAFCLQMTEKTGDTGDTGDKDSKC